MLHAIRTGKIRAGEAGVSRHWRALAAQIGMDVGLPGHPDWWRL
jgi:hypothetical protein